MATPGRRSMRRSPRTSSPATRRSTRASPAVGLVESDSMAAASDQIAGDLSSAAAASSADVPRESRSLDATALPSTPLEQMSQGRDRLRQKSLMASAPAVTGRTSRSSSRQRRPTRIAEAIKQEAQVEPSKEEPKEEYTIVLKRRDHRDRNEAQVASSKAVRGRSPHAGGQKFPESPTKDIKDEHTVVRQVIYLSDSEDYTPASRIAKTKKTNKSKDANMRQTPPDQELIESKIMQDIFEAAIRKSIEADNATLAVALNELHRRLLNDNELTVLVNRILSRKESPEEAGVFRGLIKKERKRAKHGLANGAITLESALAHENPNRPKTGYRPDSKPATPSKITSSHKPTVTLTTPSRSSHNNSAKLIDTNTEYHDKSPLASATTPVSMTVQTRRVSRRQQPVTPTSPSPKKTNMPPTGAFPVAPVPSTRSSRKRPSSTPEPFTKQNGLSATGHTDTGPPRKRAKVLGRSRSSSSSALSELSASSRETSTEAVDESTNLLPANGSYSNVIVTGVKVGGNLKRKPEPAQKARALAGAKFGLGLPDDEMELKRQELRRTEFPGYEVQSSNIRGAIKPTTRRPVPPPVEIHGVYTTQMRDQLEQNTLVSPTSSSAQGDYLIPPPPGRAKPSRSSTPAATTKKTARVKVSPVKKKNAIVAGLGARAGGNRESPVGFKTDGDEKVFVPGNGYMADSDDQSDNVDYCVTCNESGELLCCDGCPRSFHFLCCDPPLEDEPSADREWFCHVCENKRNPIAKPPRGLFSLLLHDVNRQNASIYHLPRGIRNYFEGVTEGEDGAYAYDDVASAKHRTRATGPSADIEADNLKIKDSRGNFVLCASCGKTSGGKREMIKCDFCSQHWHLDCLDPPPANPPVRPFDNRPKQLWKCPAHAELDVSQPGTHSLRRPKNFKVVDTMLNRGHRNNGDIEVELESSEDESEPETNDDGTIYRLTEKSIKLDFITRVKENNAEEERRRIYTQQMKEASLRAEQEILHRFYGHTSAEQAALGGLIGLKYDKEPYKTEVDEVPGLRNGHYSTRSADEQDPRHLIQSLVHYLIDGAPPNFTLASGGGNHNGAATNGAVDATETRNGVASVPPNSSNSSKQPNILGSKLAQNDRQALQALRDLISKRLEEGSNVEAEQNRHGSDMKVNGIN